MIWRLSSAVFVASECLPLDLTISHMLQATVNRKR
jgi:hypothetical protein